ncbi:SBBP repeat-containing protein, partial [candidate division TA06 bacterium]|nr:SBBP repeat-containing protein [candidate division TA06 bacterium]
LWVRRYDGPGNGSDDTYAIAVDDSGNVYVTGSSVRSGTSWDYATIKYNSIGDTVWVRRYNHGFGNNTPYDLALDDSGNVYVTGWSHGSGTGIDYTTIKYNSSGDTVWVRRYNGTGNGGDVAYDLDVDESGNVYVTGYSLTSTGSDYVTIKYNSIGDTLWVRGYNGSANYVDAARAIVVDNSGNVFVTGISEEDFATIKYNSNGDTVWVRKYNGPDNSYDNARDITLDEFGNIYVSGRSASTGNSWDYATVKYSSTGNLEWEIRYAGPGNREDEVSDLEVDNFGNVYVTGYSVGSGTFNDFTTIKYSQTVGIEEENAKLIRLRRTKFKLFQNQPNPFSTTALIRYQIPMKNDKLKMKNHVQLVVYDITGRLVETLVDQFQEPGVYSIKWSAKEAPSGIYFYRLTSGSITVTKKMILLR